MFGERSTSIYFVLSHHDEKVDKREFDEWYDQHLKDMVDTQLFYRASRYELVTVDTGEKHLAIYESMLSGTEVEKSMPAEINKLRENGKIAPVAIVTNSLTLDTMEPGLYCFDDKGLASPTGLLLMANNPKTPGTDSTFNTWYDDVHRLDIEATGMYQTMNRFKSVSNNEIQYLNLYETKLEEVSRAFTGLNDFRPAWEKAGTLYADRVNTLRGAYQLLASFSG